jgi:hypothetical protein
VDLVQESRSDALLHDAGGAHADVLVPGDRFGLLEGAFESVGDDLNGDPWSTHAGGTELLTTKTGTSKGCLPPHPLVRSKVLRPNTNAPVVSRVWRRNSAVGAETWKTMSVPGSRYSVSPAPYHAKSRSPPTPMGASGLSFGPLMNPSSETARPVRTFPMLVLLPLVCARFADPDSGVVMRGVGVDNEKREFGVRREHRKGDEARSVPAVFRMCGVPPRPSSEQL